VENGLGIIASSAATLRPLYLRYVKGHKGGLPDADGPRPTSAMLYNYRYRRGSGVLPHAAEFQCRGLPEENEAEKKRQQQEQQQQHEDRLWEEKAGSESAEGSAREDAGIDIERGELEPIRTPRRQRLSLPPPARSAGIRYWDGEVLAETMNRTARTSPNRAHMHIRIPPYGEKKPPRRRKHPQEVEDDDHNDTNDDDDDDDDDDTAELTTELRPAPAAHYHRSSGWTWNSVEPGLVAEEDSYHYWVVAGADSRRTSSSRAQLVGGGSGSGAGGRRTW
jgi:hypothetical protein